MKVSIFHVARKEEEKAELYLHEKNEATKRLLRYLEKEEYQNVGILCEKDGDKYRVECEKILYIDTEREKLRLHTEQEIFWLDETLRDISQYLPWEFERISKSVILNLKKVSCYKPQLNGLMAAVLENEETVYISRKYLAEIRERIREVYR